MTSDGRLLDPEGPAKLAARRLFRADPAKHADEIIAIMKPYCVRFDVEAVRGSLTSQAARVDTDN
ncbi:MAG: hypothetical protein ACE37J_15735 [Pikeienuella sp.]|uniref:hypothetical protein n=1 Tax=Pikeienuella sp. TaxID=2831957 RepID=UPI00391D382D